MLQLFARLLDGKSKVVRFNTGYAYGYQIKEKIFEITRIPPPLQRLICCGVQLTDDSLVSDRDSTVHLALRLPGGKGGFGSLLRGAATKAGQKKTNNFDACRDMSGRRLRHVNAEKRLEEWQAGEEERRLEKLAEDFLKKEAKKRGGNKAIAAERAAEKYVQGYREQSAKCVNEVEEAVKEACGMVPKRKAKDPNYTSQRKKLKIWMGKRNLGESDSEYSSDDENSGERSKKSTITSAAIFPDSKDEAERSSDSVNGGRMDGQSAGGSSGESGSEEEKETSVHQTTNCERRDENPSNGCNDKVVGVIEPCCGLTEPGSAEAVNTDAVSTIGKSQRDTEPYSAEGAECHAVKLETESSVAVPTSNLDTDLEKPLNFDEYASAADLEVLGLETLKIYLQRYGLKCGGTLEERAARIFWLKTTPLEKLPKKLLAKK